MACDTYVSESSSVLNTMREFLHCLHIHLIAYRMCVLCSF